MPKIKLSQKFIKRLIARFRVFAGGLVLLAVVAATNGSSAATGIGDFLLIVLGVAIAFSPTIVVQLFDIKTKHPKPYFVEPGSFKLALVALAMLLPRSRPRSPLFC